MPELPYRVVTDFLKFPTGTVPGEAAGVAVNSKGHIYLFQRTKPMLAEYDEAGNFLRSIAEGVFQHPHGLRIDRVDNLWTTDDGNNLVLKLSPFGAVLMVLGRISTGAEADWLFNKPADVAFAKNGRHLRCRWLLQFTGRKIRSRREFSQGVGKARRQRRGIQPAAHSSC